MLNGADLLAHVRPRKATIADVRRPVPFPPFDFAPVPGFGSLPCSPRGLCRGMAGEAAEIAADPPRERFDAGLILCDGSIDHTHMRLSPIPEDQVVGVAATFPVKIAPRPSVGAGLLMRQMDPAFGLIGLYDLGRGGRTGGGSEPDAVAVMAMFGVDWQDPALGSGLRFAEGKEYAAVVQTALGLLIAHLRNQPPAPAWQICPLGQADKIEAIARALHTDGVVPSALLYDAI